jgi:hypothetical protein
VNQSVQVLPRAYHSFATFTYNGIVYVVGEAESQSSLLQWTDANAGLVEVQSLSSPSLYVNDRVTAFLASNGVQYVVLPFYFDGATTMNFRCEVFRFDTSSLRLASVQNISTFGAYGAAATIAYGSTYLAIANNYADGNYLTVTYIMQLNNASQFIHFQNISTFGAYPPEFFQVGGNTYLAIPNHNDNSRFDLYGTIFVMNSTTKLFSLTQSIPMNAGSHLKPWSWNSQTYLSVVNSASYIETYMFNSISGLFVNLTSAWLYSYNPNGVDVASINGTIYQVVAPCCGSTDSRVFRWNSTATHFDTIQQITSTSLDFQFPLLFSVGSDTLLAMANRVFKWCGGQFVTV